MFDQVFISYRRSDAAQEALLIEAALKNTIGSDAVFLDRSSVELGDRWPDRIRLALERSKWVIVVVGPKWSGESDGRNRIYDPEDWVRKEVSEALNDQNKTVIPVLVRGAQVPHRDQLPEDIRDLPNHQSIEVRQNYWNHDIKPLQDKIGEHCPPISSVDGRARRTKVDFKRVHDLPPAQSFHQRPEFDELIRHWNTLTSNELTNYGVLILEGLGGAGKTAIAEKFVYRMPGVYDSPDTDTDITPADRVFQFTFYRLGDIPQFFRELSRWLLSKKDASSETMTYAQYQMDILDELKRRGERTLLVLDGLEAIQEYRKGSAFGSINDKDVRQLIAHTANGRIPHLYILATTRLPVVDLGTAAPLSAVKTITVGQMPRQSLIEFFRSNNVKGTDKQLDEVARRCGDHALTANLVCGYIREFCQDDLSHIDSILPDGKLEDDEDDEERETTKNEYAVRDLQEKLRKIGIQYRDILHERNILALHVLDCICISYRFFSIERIISHVKENCKQRRERLRRAVLDDLQSRSDESNALLKQLLGDAYQEVGVLQELETKFKQAPESEKKAHLRSKRVEERNTEYDIFMTQWRLSCPESEITKEKIENRLQWLCRLGLVNEQRMWFGSNTAEPHYNAHVAIREPYLRGMAPELVSISHESALRATQLELPEEYKSDLVATSWNALMAPHVGKSFRTARDPDTVSDLLEIAFHYAQDGKPSDSWRIYRYLAGGYATVCRWPHTARQGFELTTTISGAESSLDTTDAVLENSRYRIAAGQAVAALEMLARTVSVASGARNLKVAERALDEIVHALMLCSGLTDVVGLVEQRNWILASERPDFITEDGRTFSHLSESTRSIELEEHAAFCRGEMDLGRYWDSRKIQWILAAIQVGRLEEAERICNLEITEMTRDSDLRFATDRFRWRVLLSEVLARQGKIGNSQEVLATEKTSCDLGFDPITSYLWTRAVAALNLEKYSHGTDAEHNGSGDLLGNAARELREGLRVTLLSSFNLATIELLNTLAYTELCLGNHLKAMKCVMISLWGPHESDLADSLAILGLEAGGAIERPKTVEISCYGRRKTVRVGFLGAFESDYKWGIGGGLHLLGEALWRLCNESCDDFYLLDLLEHRFGRRDCTLELATDIVFRSLEIKRAIRDATLSSTSALLDQLSARRSKRE